MLLTNLRGFWKTRGIATVPERFEKASQRGHRDLLAGNPDLFVLTRNSGVQPFLPSPAPHSHGHFIGYSFYL